MSDTSSGWDVLGLWSTRSGGPKLGGLAAWGTGSIDGGGAMLTGEECTAMGGGGAISRGGVDATNGGGSSHLTADTAVVGCEILKVPGWVTISFTGDANCAELIGITSGGE